MSAVPSKNSAVVAHLSSYPSVNQAISLVKSFSLVQKAGEVTKPYIDTLNEKTKPYTDSILQKAQPTLNKADQLGDKLLSNIDTKFPAIKTVQPSDVISEVKNRFDNAKASVGNTVGTTASSVKAKYSQVYDTNGKPYVQGLEQRIAPINDKFESVIDDYLPASADSSNVTASETSEKPGELGRSFALVTKAFYRIKPAAFGLRDSTIYHVQSIYNKKVSETKGSKVNYSIPGTSLSVPLSSNIVAAINTGVTLGKETFNKLYEYVSGTPAGQKVEDSISKVTSNISSFTKKASSEAEKEISQASTTASESIKTTTKKAKAKTTDVQAAVY